MKKQKEKTEKKKKCVCECVYLRLVLILVDCANIFVYDHFSLIAAFYFLARIRCNAGRVYGRFQCRLFTFEMRIFFFCFCSPTPVDFLNVNRNEDKNNIYEGKKNGIKK